MVNYAAPLAVVSAEPATANVQVLVDTPIARVESKAPMPKEGQAPPWDTPPSKDESAENAASSSITDLLFADNPDDMDEELSTEVVQPVEAINPSKNVDQWVQIIEALTISGLAAELAKNCVLAFENSNKIELHLDPSSEMLMQNNAINEIEAALSTHFGESRKLVVTIRDLTSETPAQYHLRQSWEVQLSAERHIQNDSFVMQLTERFAAKIVPGSVKPKN